MSGKFALQRRLSEMKRQTVRGRVANETTDASDLTAKLEEVRRSFEGTSELCYFHAELIVRIRRGIDVSTNWLAFCLLWEQECDFLCKRLNSRWLISALDTYADCGQPLQRPRALISIALFNTIRLSETERALFSGETHKPQGAVNLYKQDMAQLWDGIETYNLRRGDMVWNMLRRIRRCLAPDPILKAIFETLLARALQSDTLITRINQVSEHSDKELRC